MKQFYIDLDSAIEFVTEQTSNEKNTNLTTTMVYPISNDGDDDLDMGQKEISETKYSFNEVMLNVRYDLLKTMINTLLIDDMSLNSTEETMTRAQKLAFYSLYNNNIIKEFK